MGGCQTSEDCPKREKCANNICVRNRTRTIPTLPTPPQRLPKRRGVRGRSLRPSETRSRSRLHGESRLPAERTNLQRRTHLCSGRCSKPVRHYLRLSSNGNMWQRLRNGKILRQIPFCYSTKDQLHSQP